MTSAARHSEDSMVIFAGQVTSVVIATLFWTLLWQLSGTLIVQHLPLLFHLHTSTKADTLEGRGGVTSLSL